MDEEQMGLLVMVAVVAFCMGVVFMGIAKDREAAQYVSFPRDYSTVQR